MYILSALQFITAWFMNLGKTRTYENCVANHGKYTKVEASGNLDHSDPQVYCGRCNVLWVNRFDKHTYCDKLLQENFSRQNNITVPESASILIIEE